MREISNPFSTYQYEDRGGRNNVCFETDIHRVYYKNVTRIYKIIRY
jgi:hypothetical protein